MKRKMFTISLVLSLLLGYVLWQQEQDGIAKAAVLPFAPLTVTNTNDSGAGSLRQVIADAAAGDTISFTLSGCPCTITLTSGELVINKNLTITGPDASQLTISGNNASRVFFINPGAAGATTGPPATNPVVNISNLTLANGKAKGGGGDCGGGNGGGAAGMGGAMFVNGGQVIVAQVTFSGNQAIGGNGGSGNCTGGNGGGGGGIGGNGGSGRNGNDGGAGGSLGGNGGVGLSFDANGGNGGEGGGGGGGGCCGTNGSGGTGGFGGGGGGGPLPTGAGGTSLGFGGSGGSGSPSDGGGGGGAGLGGAIFVRAGSVKLSNSTFTSNMATRGPGGAGKDGLSNGSNGNGKGGAIFIYTGATVNICTAPSFSNNTATDTAGGGTDTNDVYGTLTTGGCNTTPTINAIGVTRTAGAPVSNAPIATVNDAEDAENTLSVTATLLSGSGVTSVSGVFCKRGGIK